MDDCCIDVLGVGADGPAGLRSDLIERIHAADFLAGGARHLGYFPQARGERFVIRDNADELVLQLRARGSHQKCVVLASGDPLFYGIGNLLSEQLEHLRIEPAPSSLQIAFARAGISWQHAVTASIHGRDLRATLLPLLGRPLIGIFTHDGGSPAAVARFFLQYVEDPLYEAVVAENLGGAEERVTRATLPAMIEQQFAPLNCMIVRRTDSTADRQDADHRRALAPGIPDDAFVRPVGTPEVMTRQEVRSVLMGKLLGPAEPGDIAWDVGAGLGTVAIEMAVLRPHIEVVAVEKNVTADGTPQPARLDFLRTNRRRFEAWNVRILEGSAPAVLAGESPPQWVFIGGSGGHLAGILEVVRQRLRRGGRLAATFVTLEHLAEALDCLRTWQWPTEITQIHVARSDCLAGLTGLRPQRGVFLVVAEKPEGSSE